MYFMLRQREVSYDLVSRRVDDVHRVAFRIGYIYPIRKALHGLTQHSRTVRAIEVVLIERGRHAGKGA